MAQPIALEVGITRNFLTVICDSIYELRACKEMLMFPHTSTHEAEAIKSLIDYNWTVNGSLPLRLTVIEFNM